MKIIENTKESMDSDDDIATGQLISKGHFGVTKSTKKPTIFLKDFCPSL